MKIYFILVFFILLNAFFIISNNNLQINDAENLKEFLNLYFQWFSQIKNNLVEITGNVISQSWIP